MTYENLLICSKVTSHTINIKDETGGCGEGYSNALVVFMGL
jgi:hypothetical protein